MSTLLHITVVKYLFKAIINFSNYQLSGLSHYYKPQVHMDNSITRTNINTKDIKINAQKTWETMKTIYADTISNNQLQSEVIIKECRKYI